MQNPAGIPKRHFCKLLIGTRIAFSSNRRGPRDIYVKPASGVGDEQVLVQSEQGKSADDWSADGQYLAWEGDVPHGLFSFRDRKTVPFLRGKFLQEQCRFSLAVGKRDPQTKTRDIWVIDLQRGASSRLTFDPADDLNPTWSPDEGAGQNFVGSTILLNH